MRLRDFNFINEVNIKPQTIEALVANTSNYRYGLSTSLEYLQDILNALNREDEPSEEVKKLRDFIYDKVGDVITMFDINIKL